MIGQAVFLSTIFLKTGKIVNSFVILLKLVSKLKDDIHKFVSKQTMIDTDYINILSNCLITARRQEIIKITEQLIESINTGDFEAYT